MRLAIVAVVALVCALPAGAQTTRISREEQLRQYVELQRELARLFQEQQYEQAAAKAQQIIKLAPKQPDGPYNLACALARLGKSEAALEALAKAIELGYSQVQHMREDADLESLRKHKRFEELADKARRNELDKPFEQGKPIAGLKMFEGFPEGGLRYRLRLGEKATKDKPHRLIIWLHPSGGSMNSNAEALSPMLAKEGFALLVLTQKSFVGWSDADARKLLDKTLPEVAKIEGLDASRPILFGYSAGGQMALSLWSESPDKFGGLILDAAYPIDAQQYQRGRVVAMPLPKGEGLKKTPVFVLVGALDGGSQLWRQVAPKWQDAGVPLTLHIVPQGRHQWLLGKAQTEALKAWLGEVAAGKLPMGALPTTKPAQPDMSKFD